MLISQCKRLRDYDEKLCAITLLFFRPERLFQSRDDLREIDEEYGPHSFGGRTESEISFRSPIR